MWYNSLRLDRWVEDPVSCAGLPPFQLACRGVGRKHALSDSRPKRARHPERVILKIGPDWDDPEGLTFGDAICLWSPELSRRLGALTGPLAKEHWRLRQPIGMFDPEAAADFGNIPDHLKSLMRPSFWEKMVTCCPGKELCLFPESPRCLNWTATGRD